MSVHPRHNVGANARRFANSRLFSVSLIAGALALPACNSGGGSSSVPVSAPSGPQTVAPTAGATGHTLSYFEMALTPGQVFATVTRTGAQSWTAVDFEGQVGVVTQVNASDGHVELYNPDADQWWMVDLVNNEVRIGDQGSTEAHGTLLLMTQRFG